MSTSVDDDDDASLLFVNKAGEQLIERLLDLLGDCVSERTNKPEEHEEITVGTDEDHLYQQRHRTSPPKGISLPAVAIAWLVRHTAHSNNHTDDEADVAEDDDDKTSLLLVLLHHVQSLRVTLEPWPEEKNHHHNDIIIDPMVAKHRFVSNLFHRPSIDLCLFPKLQILWLDQIPIEWITNAFALKESLQVLRITQSCIYNLRESPLLLWKDYDRREEVYTNTTNNHGLYSSLTHLKLSWCGLHDHSGLKSRRQYQQPLPSLALVSRKLRSMDLSHNELSTEAAAMGGLQYMPELQKLDLSYNRLTNVPNIHLRLTNIRILNLSYNKLIDVQGMERLSSLITLRLNHNRLEHILDTANRLAGLSQLKHLSLEGNPIQFLDGKEKISDTYRIDILNAFRERRFGLLQAADFANMTLRSVQALLPLLDCKPASLNELRSLRSRTFIPIRLVPMAVQRSAKQTRRSVVNIVDGDIMTGHRKRSSNPNTTTSRTSVSLTFQDVLVFLSTNSMYAVNTTTAARSDQTQVPENVVVETFRTDPTEREEWEIAFSDDLGMRYLANARPPLIVRKTKATQLVHQVDLALNTSTAQLVAKPSVKSDTWTLDTKPNHSHEIDSDDLVNLSLSAIKDDEDEMKASGTTTITTAASTQPGPSQQIVTSEMTVGLLNTNMDQHSASSATPQGTRLSLQIAPFSDHHWQDDNSSVPSSLGTPYKNDGGLTKWEILRLAEENSKFEGSYVYQKLLVHNQLDLYFEQFVFAEPKKVTSEIWYDTLCQYPKIGLWPVDRKRRDDASQTQHFTLNGDDREVLRRVWKETIVPCGKHALRRLTPKRSERYGFHGELLWTSTNAESMRPDVTIDARQVICCNSDKCFYIIIDHDTATATPKSDRKQFPRPLPKKAVFRNACWPHAMACHSFDSLERITIGFSFQRLTLQFHHAATNEIFVYVLLTASKLATVELLKEFQELAGNAKGSGFAVTDGPMIEIDNDDPVVLDSIGSAIAPDSLGVVLHYQIVRQRWKHGDRGLVRRVCILTDSSIYLMDEDYSGDGSTRSVDSCLGQSSNRLVDGAPLTQIVEVQAASDDPTSITIVLRLAALSKPHNWRLVCRTKDGAERLVDDVRKATRGLRK